MFKSIRLIFYIVLAVGTFIAVSKQKSIITESKTSTTTSVLSILQNEGVPVEVFTVKPRTVAESIKTALENCGSQYCFHLSYDRGKHIKAGNLIFSPDSNKKIGKVTSVSGLNPLTGLIRAQASLDKKPEKKENRFLIVEIATKKIPNALAVPTNSIGYDSESSYVWLFNNGKPKKQHVKLGVQTNSLTEVRSGLNVGDEVVSVGQGLLHQYDKARLITKENKEELN